MDLAEVDAVLAKVEKANTPVDKFAALGLNPQLAEACARLGWKGPTPIQIEAVPQGLQGKDVIGLAQTGSGKTAAFALPILHALLDKPERLFAAILSPTRELALQIAEQFEALGAEFGLKCVAVVGGIDMMQQACKLATRPHIVVSLGEPGMVGTPGRLVDHLTNTKGFSLRTLKFLVLDEADRLLNMDFEAEIDEILKAVPKERRTFLFSATMTSKVAKLQRACLKNPVKVEVSSKYSTVSTLRQQFLLVPAAQKDYYLAHLLTELAGCTAMVFTRTCDATRKVALMLRNLGLAAIPISGKLSQPKRLGALAKFKGGERSILIATDVASRGLDIPSVDVVINYEIPTNPKDYIHRVGRTARAGRSGRAVSMVTQYDLELFTRIEKLVEMKMEAFPVEPADIALISDRVEEARKMACARIRDQDSSRKGKRKSRGFGDNDEGEGGGMGYGGGGAGGGGGAKRFGGFLGKGGKPNSTKRR